MTEAQGTNLDPWYSHYAQRTAGLSASEVRALFAVASRPEVVSLAGALAAWNRQLGVGGDNAGKARFDVGGL